jgi:hypothetical protein
MLCLQVFVARVGFDIVPETAKRNKSMQITAIGNFRDNTTIPKKKAASN